MNLDSTTIQWIILLLFGGLFVWLAPLAKTKEAFFQAKQDSGKQPSFWILTSSLVISWIFAKSITNAANLGLSYGIVGGLAYSAYYLSFLAAGIIIFRLRSIGGFKSIHHFLQTKYGRSAVLLFSLLIGFRLFNEIWSNSMIIGSYFGDIGSTSYYVSILVFTLLTLLYVLKGGLQSSLLTDFIQMILFTALLVIILILIFPAVDKPIGDYLNSGTWSLDQGVNLLLVALLQVFSYPFHDPVLTDRAFILPPKATLKSFAVATVIGFACILLFSFIGVAAKFLGASGQAAVEIGKILGVVPMLMLNLIMITSAASTIDSAITSFSKLSVQDTLAQRKQTLKRGRIMMVIITVVGTIPVFLDAEILSATTISGTMVIGLAPIFLFWRMKAPKVSYFLSLFFGIMIGVLIATGAYPKQLHISTGKYADLLSANLYGTIGCFILFLVPALLSWGRKQKT